MASRGAVGPEYIMTNHVELATNLALVNNYQTLARDYGLFAEKVSVARPGDEPKEYLVFSLSRITDDVNPAKIIARNQRNKHIFYPENFAVELPSKNPLLMWEQISGYLAYAELICDAYTRFETPLPKSIRVDEVEALANFYSKMLNPNFDEETRREYYNGLREFFEDENPKSRFKKEWQAFYRSELFDSEKSFLKNFMTFLKRHEPETSLDALIESNGDLKKVYMPEHHYQEFREIIKARYPNVKYSVSDKRVVDKGIIVDPKTNQPVETPYGKTVSEEAYDQIVKERFAREGFACVDGLTPSYFEGRDIVYKASDEHIIASVGHEIAYRWAECADLETLQRNGPLGCIEIPGCHMMNFYVAMKDAGIPIHIDNDIHNDPVFETVRVVYNKCHEHTVQTILVGLAMAQVNLAHVSLNDADVMFDIDVKKVDALIQQAKTREAALASGDRPALASGKSEMHSENASLDL